MLCATNLADNIRSLHRHVRERILNIEVNARPYSAIEIALKLPLVFRRHRDDRSLKVGIKAEDSGVRQIPALRFATALAANARDDTGWGGRSDEVRHTDEVLHSGPPVGLPSHDHQRDFSFEVRDVL